MRVHCNYGFQSRHLIGDVNRVPRLERHGIYNHVIVGQFSCNKKSNNTDYKTKVKKDADNQSSDEHVSS